MYKDRNSTHPQTLAGLPVIEGYRGEPMIDYDRVDFQGLRGEVRQADIDEGIPEDCNKCAVARAVARMFPDCEVTVSSFIFISRKCLAYAQNFTTSRALRKWIGDYDYFFKKYSGRYGNPVHLVIRKDTQSNRDFMIDIADDRRDL